MIIIQFTAPTAYKAATLMYAHFYRVPVTNANLKKGNLIID
jgi:hypothetical protein